MTEQETLELYAKHEGAEWWPAGIKADGTVGHCQRDIFGNRALICGHRTPYLAVAVLALRGALLTWLAGQKTYIYSIELDGEDVWMWFEDFGSGRGKESRSPDGAALAAYECLSGRKHD